MSRSSRGIEGADTTTEVGLPDLDLEAAFSRLDELPVGVGLHHSDGTLIRANWRLAYALGADAKSGAWLWGRLAHFARHRIRSETGLSDGEQNPDCPGPGHYEYAFGQHVLIWARPLALVEHTLRSAVLTLVLSSGFEVAGDRGLEPGKAEEVLRTRTSRYRAQVDGILRS